MSCPLDPYLSPEALAATVGQSARALRAELRQYGNSVKGRPLVAVRIPVHRSAAHDKSAPPRVLLCANIHGPELIGNQVALGFLNALRHENDDVLQALRRRAEIWVIPAVNPDGYARTYERHGRGTLNELRANANGVDLNRNFPRPAAPPWWAPSFGGWATGSDDVDNPFYRGSGPLSEPETACLDALFDEVKFHASANLHSTMGTVFHAHVRDRGQQRTYAKLAGAFTSAQRHTRYKLVSARHLDWFTGEQEDHQHHVHDCWAICVEVFPVWHSVKQHPIAPTTFWRFNPRDPTPWIENDVPALAAYFRAALDTQSPSQQ